MNWSVSALQIMLLAASLAALLGLALHFPMPSPLIAGLLPPQKRWPTEQVRAWAESGAADPTFLAFFERDPERTVPDEGELVAPADGLIREVFVRDGTRYAVIALSFWDVHVQRAPCDAVVRAVLDHGDVWMDGEGSDAVFLRDKAAPVQKVVVLETARGPMAVRLITSLSARRIEVWVEPGQTLRKGQRLGRIRFGSTVVLEVPEDVALDVRPGDRVVGGETVLWGVRGR